VAAAVSAATGRVFVGSYDSGTVSVLDSRDGALLRTVTLGNNPVVLAVSAATSHVFVADDGGTVTMLDARSGSLLRATGLGQTPWGIAVAERAGHVFVLNHGSVSMLDARDGALLRTVNVAVGALFGGTNNSEGSGGLGRTPIAVDERTDRVFIAGSTLDQGQIAMLDAATDSLLDNRATAALPISVEVDGRSGRVLVTALDSHDPAGNPTGPGNVLVLDGRNTAVRHTVRVGVGPYAIVAPADAGRAYVVDMDSNPDGSPIQALQAPSGWWAAWTQRLPRWLPLARAPMPVAGGDVRVLDLAAL
jgi:DNA-binding beta-propeller fold protein YncE